MPFPSALIRFWRLERNWSQEGLCKGVCAVSYLSKIEQGKADPAPEILDALIARLGIEWHAEAAREAGEWVEAIWEALSSMDHEQEAALRRQLQEKRELYLNGPHMLDVMLLEKLHYNAVDPLGQDKALFASFEDCFDMRQRAWYLLLQERCQEAAELLPTAFVYLACGSDACYAGSYARAIEHLLRCCTLAAEEGRARVLMYARVMLGNCYSDLNDLDSTRRHYAAARRLAHDLKDRLILGAIDYNLAATELQMGQAEKAYAYFVSMEKPYVMALHKLAICQEKLGKISEALETLDRAAAEECLHGEDDGDYPDREMVDRMCALVRWRLEHPDYLHQPAYGEMLLALYRDIKQKLPHGFALFHQPWVEEWYVASRQYKQAYELKR